VDIQGSDLHFKTDTGKIYIRVHGDLISVEDAPPFTSDEFRNELQYMLRPDQVEKFDRDLELDFAHEIKGISHYGVYREGFAEATGLELDWFTRHLKKEEPR